MAVAPAALDALGNMGAAALTSPPQQNLAHSGSDSYMGGVGGSTFGAFTVVGGSRPAGVAMTDYNAQQRTALFNPSSPDGMDKTILLIVGGIALIWLFGRKK